MFACFVVLKEEQTMSSLSKDDFAHILDTVLLKLQGELGHT